MSSNAIPSSSKYTEIYGTPPSSPATMSAFSRAVGAAAIMTNKQASNQTQTQIQNTGNPLGFAAVLLQGVQAGSAGGGSSSGSSNNSQNSQVGVSPSSPASVNHQANGSNEPIASRRQDSSSTARRQEIIKMTEQLIESINTGDFEAYTLFKENSMIKGNIGGNGTIQDTIY
ncbi:PREDICTED: calcium/calmodulin-dependent protein kinase type II subunit gamma-like [Wasmannia auropunctata]|uniref:calcium/calmodulin-dependent protein kinase type II subunit gamma-like n=1 Tax=Wasmannia auropunctata TaxID=64793 RepID=UPI0005F0BA09|nr:PREDICTED: calcium/calmodulin-dependent protein kinase type II subunit gamma-like [Wasmannia auropunctata]